MDDRLLGKRSRGNSESIDSSESSKRRQGDNTGATSSKLEEMRRHHHRFSNTVQEAYRQAELDLELRLGPSTKPHLELRLGPPQIDSHEASSSHQPLGWQEEQSAFRRWEPKASRATQPHQETRSFPQQEVIDEQMSINTLSDSDNESNHEKTYHQAGTSHLVIHDAIISLDQIPWYQITQRQRNIQLEHTGDESRYRQTQGDFASLGSRPDRSLNELLIFAQAVKNRGHRERLTEDLNREIRSKPFNYSEYRKIRKIYKIHGFKGSALHDLMCKVYNMSEMGKEATKRHRGNKSEK